MAAAEATDGQLCGYSQLSSYRTRVDGLLGMQSPTTPLVGSL
jgi:hypothetical protein